MRVKTQPLTDQELEKMLTWEMEAGTEAIVEQLKDWEVRLRYAVGEIEKYRAYIESPREGSNITPEDALTWAMSYVVSFIPNNFRLENVSRLTSRVASARARLRDLKR